MKKLYYFLIIIAAVLLCFCACGKDKGDKPSTNNGSGAGSEASTLVYGNGVNTVIVVPSEGDTIDTSFVSNAVFDASGAVCGLRDDSSKKTPNEIVIGNTTRDISASAKTELNKALRSAIIGSVDEDIAEKDLVGFCVYADGGSLALVWSDDTIKEIAFDYLATEYLCTESLDSSPKILDTQIISLSEYYEELVYEQKNAEWEKLRQGFIDFGCDEKEAEECVKAVQNFYSLADESVYLWIANLYDPETGGFYYSNSARDTAGFLPDIESTFQAINLLRSNGMFDDFGEYDDERLQNALPVEMQEKIVAFVQNCQSEEDGYFHHPQWVGMDSAWTSRLGRDLSWSMGILDWFDKEPLYTLPTERGVASETKLTDRLGVSTAKMVSKVVAVDAVPDYLETPEKWREHLLSYDWEKSSYQTAHTIGSQTNMIRSRGQEYVDILEEVFNEKQKAHNGLWEEGVYYASTNGLMKTVAAMNSLGIKLNYADKAFESAIKMAKHTGKDEEGFIANHIVDVYNPWYAMDDILTNVEKYGDPAESEALRATLIAEAKELIEVSMLKTAPFKKNDGSFGYNYDFSPSTSQGAPVSVPGTVEGDVNGCVMAFNGVIGNLLGTFGIESPRRFFINDYFRFIEEIEGLGPVIKSNVGVDAEVITFDDEPLGNSEPDAFSSVNIPNGSGQTELREGSESDVVFHITDTSRASGSSVRVVPGGVPMGASRCVLEFDINVKSSSDGIIYQIFVGTTYQLTLTSEGTSVRLGDSSTKGVTNDFGVTFKKGEWHKIRIEYFFTGDAETTVTKIFLDGHLRALSDNFYGKKPDGASKPDLSFPEVHFYTLFEPTVDVYIDNIYANKDNEIYKEEPVTNPYRVSDFENVEEGELPEGITPTLYNPDAVFEIVDNSFEDKDGTATGKVLHFSAATGAAQFNKKIESLVTSGNAYVFESDIYIADASKTGAITQTYFKADGGLLFALTFAGGEDSTGKYVELCTLNTQNNTPKQTLCRIPLLEWVNLRIEYYRYQYEIGEDGNLWAGVKVRVLLDKAEVFNGLCDYPSPNTLSKNALNFQNYVLNGKSIDMYFDNMVFELARLTYVNEKGDLIPDPETPAFPKGGAPTSTPAGADHNGVFDFESAEIGLPSVGGLSTVPNENEYGNNVEIAIDPEGDKALKFVTVPSQKYGNSASFEADKKIPTGAGVHVVEFSIRADKAAGRENYVQLYTFDSVGGVISSYNILFPKGVNGEVVITSRVPESHNSEKLSAKVDYSGGYVKIKFEYYEQNGMTKLYVNDTVIAEGYACNSGTVGTADISSLKMSALIASEFLLYVDDVTVSQIQKTYVPFK